MKILDKLLKILFTLVVFFFSSRSFIFAQIVINEFTPDASPEWVEFYNASDSAEFVKNYFIDDDISFIEDSGSKPKILLANVNTNNTQYPYVEVSSVFNNDGDYVVLFDSVGNIIDQYQYSKNPGDNISIGRSPDSTGSFLILSASSKGGINAPPPTSTPTPLPTPTNTPKPVEPTNTPKPTSTPKPEPTSKPAPTTVPTKIPTAVPAPSATPKPTNITHPSPTSISLSFVLSPTTYLSPTPLLNTGEGNERGEVLGASINWPVRIGGILAIIAGAGLVLGSGFVFLRNIFSRGAQN